MATVIGCTDTTAVNYDPLANTDDGSCTYCNNDTSYNLTSCDSVLWNGITYNSSGTYYSNSSSNNNYSMSFDGLDDYVDFLIHLILIFFLTLVFHFLLVYILHLLHRYIFSLEWRGLYQNRGIFIRISNNILTAKIRGNQSDPYDTDI